MTTSHSAQASGSGSSSNQRSYVSDGASSMSTGQASYNTSAANFARLSFGVRDSRDVGGDASRRDSARTGDYSMDASTSDAAARFFSFRSPGPPQVSAPLRFLSFTTAVRFQI